MSHVEPYWKFVDGSYHFNASINRGSNIYWKHPSAAEVVRSTEQLAADALAGIEWRNDAILHEYVRGKSSVGTALYVAQNGRRWATTVAAPLFYLPDHTGTITVTATFTAFGEFDAMPATQTVSKDFTLAQLGINVIPEAGTQYPSHRCMMISIDALQDGSKALCAIVMTEVPETADQVVVHQYTGRGWWELGQTQDLAFYSTPTCYMSVLEIGLSGDPAAGTGDFSVTVVRDTAACIGTVSMTNVGIGNSHSITHTGSTTTEISGATKTVTEAATGYIVDADPELYGPSFSSVTECDIDGGNVVTGKIVGAWYEGALIKFATVDYAHTMQKTHAWSYDFSGAQVTTYTGSDAAGWTLVSRTSDRQMHRVQNRSGRIDTSCTLYVDGNEIDTFSVGVSYDYTQTNDTWFGAGGTGTTYSNYQSLDKTLWAGDVSYDTSWYKINEDPSVGFSWDPDGNIIYEGTADRRNVVKFYEAVCTRGWDRLSGARDVPNSSGGLDANGGEWCPWGVSILQSSHKIFRIWANASYGGYLEPAKRICAASKAGYAAVGASPVGTITALPVAERSTLPDLYASLHPLTGQLATGDRPVNWI